MIEIGQLIDVSPRDAWKHEAREFTPWLAENLAQLGGAIGLQLEPEGIEVSVGAFSADILARDTLGRLVLVENQLETTDHIHLGQILTYLSGLDAEIVIWIATEFRDPHLSAVNWLNEHTSDRFAFFAIRLRVVRIGDSPPAPVFDVLVRPNEWDREMQQIVRRNTGEASRFAAARRGFWRHYLRRHPDDEKLGAQLTASSSNWLVPPQNIGLVISIYKAKNGVGVFFRGPRGTTPAEVQSRLAPYAQKFEKLVGTCRHLGDENKHPADDLQIDTEDRANWDKAADWLHERSHAFLDATTEIFGEKNPDQ